MSCRKNSVRRQWRTAGRGERMFRSSDDVRKGYVRGISAFRTKAVQFSVIDDIAIFEGDIALGTAADMEALRADIEGQVPADGAVPNGGAAPEGDVAVERRRHHRGALPLAERGRALHVDCRAAPPGAASDRALGVQDDIRFPERTAAQANYVSFEAQDGCWSFVGMQGGKQVISLGAGCGFGQAVHEMGHAVGLWHEQSREDRNARVRIVWENIQAGRQHNFNQHITDGDDLGGYDFGSIMHYRVDGVQQERPTHHRAPGRGADRPARGPQRRRRRRRRSPVPPQGVERLGRARQAGHGLRRRAFRCLAQQLRSATSMPRGNDNALWQRAFFNGAWHGWGRHNDGGVLASEPALGSMGPVPRACVRAGQDNQVWQKWWTACGGWSGWVALGAPPGGFQRRAGGDLAQQRRVQHLRGAATTMRFGRRRGSTTPGTTGGGTTTAACWRPSRLLGSMGPDHEHVFVRGTDNQVWQKWWTGGVRLVGLGGARRALRAAFNGAPAVISRNNAVCNIYVRGNDNALWQKAFWNGAWHGWGRHNDGGVLASEPALDSMGPDHEHVFVRGTDNQVWQKWWVG